MVDIHQIKKKVIIIGYGSMGKKYEKILNKKFKIDIYDKKKINQKNLINNLKLINKDNYYFAVISTPPKYHQKFCNLCIDGNLDFIVEKPLFLKRDGWNKIIKKIEKKKLICNVAYPRRLGLSYNYLKDLIDKGKIGKLKIIKSNFSQDFRNLRKDYKKIYYSKKNQGGGIIYDALTHHLNLMSFYGGKIKEIKKYEDRLEYKDIKVSDSGIMIIKFYKKIMGIIYGNQFQKPNIDEIEFIGTKGNLIFDRIKNTISIVGKKETKIKKFNETYEDMFKKQITFFLYCINKRLKTSTSISEEFNNLSKI